MHAPSHCGGLQSLLLFSRNCHTCGTEWLPGDMQTALRLALCALPDVWVQCASQPCSCSVLAAGWQPLSLLVSCQDCLAGTAGQFGANVAKDIYSLQQVVASQQQQQ